MPFGLRFNHDASGEQCGRRKKWSEAISEGRHESPLILPRAAGKEAGILPLLLQAGVDAPRRRPDPSFEAHRQSHHVSPLAFHPFAQPPVGRIEL